MRGGFTKKSAQRISRAVISYEQGQRDQPGVRLGSMADDFEPVRLGKTTETWNKGDLADIELYEDGEPGSETISTPTLLKDCVNKFANVAADRWVIVALGPHGAYYLMAAECP